MRSVDMNRNSPVRQEWRRRSDLVELASRQKVRELAVFLGLDAGVVAEGLVDAVQRDPALRRNPHLQHSHAA
jgi:hypothetical protein